MDIYVISDVFSNSAFRGAISVDDYNTNIHARRAYSCTHPIAVRRMSGRVLKDFIWTGAATPLVSDRVISLLREAGLSGWTTYAVTLLDASEREIPGYAGLAITGRCNWIDFDRREEALTYRPNRSGTQTRYFVGLKFDESSWDGSDFFMDAEEKRGWVLVTERVRSVFKSGKVTNCDLDPLERVEMIAQRSAIIPKAT